ncbi:hypothetical protein SLEP1_g52711 [Rubroshorea leprosula]|uniref:Uncharacterized protein n=1 Tax=Rubroshorea leprosula TaxID=152421 RepID=A0AAV5M7A1_9ROSI|nr:hypothetical protein SLEP1_g52710 [Rubroshorea leprosula]GKV45650.1 hypothetical protein SLEP1_g52711 [Rubroshorea leprosula]
MEAERRNIKLSGTVMLLILLIITDQGLIGSCRSLQAQRPSDKGVSQRGPESPSGPSNCTYTLGSGHNSGGSCKSHG